MRLPWVVGGEEPVRRCEPPALERGGPGKPGQQDSWENSTARS